MTFIYDPRIPPEAKTAIVEHLEPLSILLPGWIQTVKVFWCDDPDDETFRDGAAIWAQCQYEYRHMALTFTPVFLTLTPDERRDAAIHDVLHAITSVFADYARAELLRLLPEDDAPNYRGAVLDELTRRHESLTQDFAFLIDTLLRNQKQPVS